MPRIERVRPVLLTAPYASQDNLEVLTRLPTGWRTTGLVEIALDDGTTGLGEGYLAVFAPQVFVDIVEMLSPHLVGWDADDIASLYRELTRATGYWSRQGAARHVVAAMEIALIDAASKRLGVPAYRYLAGGRITRLSLYASGGDSPTPEAMAQEIEQVKRLGLKAFKIRAGKDESDRAVWTLERAAAAGISIAIDMTQNLAEPGHEPDDVYHFLAEVGRTIAFLEEPLSFSHLDNYRQLRERAGCPVAGGETVTTSEELIARIRAGWYDIAQPDATVIGGMGESLRVLNAAQAGGREAVVHCWGSAVGVAANYHCALAGRGELAEWPLPAYPLRDELLLTPFVLEDGCLQPPQTPGLGVRLDDDIERRYPFRPDATYHCIPLPGPARHVVWA